jgi:hypothetical protein
MMMMMGVGDSQLVLAALVDAVVAGDDWSSGNVIMWSRGKRKEERI